MSLTFDADSKTALLIMGSLAVGSIGSIFTKKSWPILTSGAVAVALFGAQAIVDGGITFGNNNPKSAKMDVIKKLARKYYINTIPKSASEALLDRKPLELPKAEQPPNNDNNNNPPEPYDAYPDVPKYHTPDDYWPGVGARNGKNLVPRSMDPELPLQKPIPMSPVVTADVGPRNYDTSAADHIPRIDYDYPLMIRRPEMAVFKDPTDDRMRWQVGGVPPATHINPEDLCHTGNP